MIELIPSHSDDIDAFVVMEQVSQTSAFILPYSAEQHLQAMQSPEIQYLSIYDNGELAGFIMLAIEPSEGGFCSAEFRRIVVATQGKGIGQQAIVAMEMYCQVTLACTRIWLDVFATNSRGIHIYTKLGYREFKVENYQGQTLVFMHKVL